MRRTHDDVGAVIGASIRSTSESIGWSQRELARRLGTNQSAIRRLQAGGATMDVRLATAALDVLGIRLTLDANAMGIVGRREQTDFVHARCSAHVASRLRAAGWDVRSEVEIGSGRYRGWIDLLAYRAIDRCAFCIELKTEIDDMGRIQRTLGWYEREAWDAARQLGWRPRSMATGLLVLQSTDNDSRIRANRDSLQDAFPARAIELGRWIATPVGPNPGRGLAMIDPRSRRTEWLRPTTTDGRRSPAPYADYRAAAVALDRR